jgi:glycerol transport system ATP-binding protein
VTQFGRTAEIYRRPTDLVSARVFSDPPINTSPAEKRGNEIHIGQIRLPIGRSARGIPDGAYVIGIRPHHIAPSIENGTVATIEGKVVIAELSGSESVVHFALGDVTWVSQSRGTQSFELGSTAQLKINMDHAFFFDLDHRRVVGTE